jgi:hypothetical protein
MKASQFGLGILLLVERREGARRRLPQEEVGRPLVRLRRGSALARHVTQLERLSRRDDVAIQVRFVAHQT